MRVRLLQARGWHVVSIPFYEWKQCGNQAAAQQAYLRSKLPPQLLEVRLYAIPAAVLLLKAMVQQLSSAQWHCRDEHRCLGVDVMHAAVHARPGMGKQPADRPNV